MANFESTTLTMQKKLRQVIEAALVDFRSTVALTLLTKMVQKIIDN